MTGIAAIVLAAGSSQRFGAENKLLATIDNKPVLQHVLDRLAPLTLSRRIVVVRPGDDGITSLIDKNAFDIVENSKPGDGMGSSISAGIGACHNADGVFLMLGDLPHVRQDTCEQLLAAFFDYPDKTIFAPIFQGQRGHPVLFRRRHFDALMALGNDIGAKPIIADNKATLLALPTDDAGILSDVDRPGDAVPLPHRTQS